MDAQPTKRKRRWPRRVALGVIAAVLAAASVPFLFTTSLVRYTLEHSAYARYSPTIDRASLSPAGELRIENITLHDTGAAVGRPLVTIGRLSVTFGWGEIWSSRLRQIRAEDTTFYVRPGTAGAISLLDLANPSAPPTPPPAPAAPQTPLWVDRLICRGSLEVEPMAGLTMPANSWPLALSLVMHGPRETPRRSVEATLGHEDGTGPLLQTRLESSAVPGEPLVRISQLEGREITLAAAPELLRRWAPNLPATWQKPVAVQLAEGDIAGEIQNHGGTLWFQGNVKLRDATSGFAGVGDVRHLNVTADMEAPLTAAVARELVVSRAQLDAQDITWDRWHVTALAAAGNLEEQKLFVNDLRGRLADGGLVGKFTCDLTHGFASLAGNLRATHLNIAAVLGDYFPNQLTGIDRFVDVTAQLDRNAQGQRGGHLQVVASPAADQTTPQPPLASVTVTLHELPTEQALQIDSAVAEHWNLAAPAEMLRQWAGTMPAAIDERLARQGSVRVALEKVEAAGRLDYGPTRHFDGKVAFTGLGVAAPLTAGDQAGLEKANLSAQVAMPLSAGGKPLAIEQFQATVGRVACGPQSITDLTLAGAFTPERLTLAKLSASLADGTIAGHLTADLARQALPTCDLAFRGIDARHFLPTPLPTWLAGMTRYDGRLVARLDPGEPLGNWLDLPNHRAGSIYVDLAAAAEPPSPAPDGTATPAPAAATQSARHLVLRAQGDGHGQLTLQELSLSNVYVMVQADQIKDWARHYGIDLPDTLAVDWTTSLDVLYLAGRFALGSHKQFSGTAEIKSFSVNTPPDAQTVIELAGVSTRADLNIPFNAQWLDALAATDGRLSLDRAAAGPSHTDHLFTRWTISHGLLATHDTTVHLANGTLTGKAALNLSTLAMPICDFTVKQIDVHQVLKNIIPERLDAAGLFDGTIHLERGPGKEGEFNGSIDLAATTPGSLKIGDIPKLKETLAAAQGADIAALAMEDLRNYPFQFGKIHIESRGPDTLIKPTFQRDLNAPATPVEPRTIIIAGQPKMLATAKVATISSPEVLLTGISLQKILAMASGLSPYFEVLKQGLEKGKKP